MSTLALISDGELRGAVEFPALTLMSGGWLYESAVVVQPQPQPLRKYGRRIQIGGGLGGLMPLRWEMIPPVLRRRLPAPFSRLPTQKDVVEFAVKASVQVASALGMDDVYEQMAIGVAEELLLMRLDR